MQGISEGLCGDRSGSNAGTASLPKLDHVGRLPVGDVVKDGEDVFLLRHRPPNLVGAADAIL